MQQYKYTAVNLQNQTIKGTFIAEDERDLARQLAKQGLYLTGATLYSGKTPSAFFTMGTGKIGIAELTTFSRQFAIMLSTHIPLLECIDLLRHQSYSGYFKKIIDVIYEDVKGGSLLYEALEKHRKVFPHFFRSMVSVGENSGKLDLVFTSLADYYEKEAAMRRKLLAAMAYPAMLFLMAIGLVVLMMVMVVPTFREALADLEVEPEGITKAVYDFYDFIIAWGQLILSGVMILGIAIFLYFCTERGKYARDIILLKLPLVNKIQINTATARFSRAFALLISSGMDLNEAMTAVEVILTNRYLKRRFRAAAEYVRYGMSLTSAFDSLKLFPPMMIKMIAIGEKTNSLDEVLLRSCNFFDVQVENSISSFTSKIAPAMLILMGSIVAILFIAVYSPMLSIMGGLG